MIKAWDPVLVSTFPYPDGDRQEPLCSGAHYLNFIVPPDPLPISHFPHGRCAVQELELRVTF